MLCPIIDMISDGTMAYNGGGGGAAVGGFWWSLHFKWISRLDKSNSPYIRSLARLPLPTRACSCHSSCRFSLSGVKTRLTAHLCLVRSVSQCKLRGWTVRLEPLLARIAEKRTAVLCPRIEHIFAITMAYISSVGGNVGGFGWNLHFTWIPVAHRSNSKGSINPIPFTF